MTLSLSNAAKAQRESLKSGYSFTHGVDEEGREYSRTVEYGPSRVTLHTPLGVEHTTWADLTPAQRKLQRRKQREAAQQRQHAAATQLISAEFAVTTAEFELKQASQAEDARQMRYWAGELTRAQRKLAHLKGEHTPNPRKSAKRVIQTKQDGRHVLLYKGEVRSVQTPEQVQTEKQAHKLAKEKHALLRAYHNLAMDAARQPEKAAALAPWQQKLVEALESLHEQEQQHAEAVGRSARFHARSENGGGSGQM
jgi:hypothetical protein